MRVADVIFDLLKSEVDTVFMLPGGGAMHLNDALGLSGIRYVVALHEQGAGYMALAYAQMRGFGVCLVTSGPGSTNAVTPCAACWTDSVPVLFISGTANSKTLVGTTGLRTRGVQEIDIIPIVRPITKIAIRAKHADRVLDILGILISTAKAGRPGPVWLDIPLDIQGAEWTSQ